MISQLDIALQYSKAGIRVFPCAQTKAPLTKNGFKLATTDEKQIRSWWTKHPDALIGGTNDQFVVIDIDSHGLCPTGALLTNTAIENLEKADIINDDSVKVKTMSGGTHVYFQKDDTLTRKISALPNIDICANNGYSILPDQKTYVATTDTPWKMFASLPKLDTEALNGLIESMAELTKGAKILKKAMAPKDKTVAKRFKEQEKKSDLSDLRYTVTEETVTYKQTETSKTYARSDKKYDNDHTQSILNKDGKVRIEPFSIKTAETLMTIFHNQEIQKKLARHLGLDVPTIGSDIVQTSIFPNHPDLRPSMGVRWREDGACLVIRDFANHHADCQNNLDFNLTRIFVTLRQKTLAPRLEDNEFNMHFLNLMYEANMLDIDMYDFYEDINKLKGVNKKVAECIRRLTSFKRLFADWDGFVCLTQAFGAAFCNISPKSVSNAKKWLTENYFLANHGWIKTNAKSESTFFSTEAIVMRTNYSDYPDYFDELDQEIHQEKAKEYAEFGKIKDAEKRARYAEKMEKTKEAERQKAIESGEKSDTPVRIVAGKKKFKKDVDINEKLIGKKIRSAFDILKERKASTVEYIEPVNESIVIEKKQPKLLKMLQNVDKEKLNEALTQSVFWNRIQDQIEEGEFMFNSNISMSMKPEIERYYKGIGKRNIPKTKVDLREFEDRTLCYVVNSSGNLNLFYVYRGEVYREDRHNNLVKHTGSPIMNDPIHASYIPAGSGWDVGEDDYDWSNAIVSQYDDDGNLIGYLHPNGEFENVTQQ